MAKRKRIERMGPVLLVEASLLIRQPAGKKGKIASRFRGRD